MNYRKKITILSSTLGILIIVYFLLLLLSPRSPRQIDEKLIGNLSVEDVVRIELDLDGDSLISLSGTEENWTIAIGDDFFPARYDRISSFLENIAALQIERRVTDNVDVAENFDLDSDSAKKITLYNADNSSLFSLLTGKSAPTNNRRYAQLDEASDILLVSDEIGFYLQQSENYWSALGIYPDSLDGEQVVSISIDANNLILADAENPLSIQYSINREVDAWTAGEEYLDALSTDDADSDATRSLDTEKIDRVIDSLLNLDGAEFVVTGLTDLITELDMPAATIGFTLDNGQRYGLEIGARDPENTQRFFARPIYPNASRQYSYYTSVWNLERIMQPLDGLLSDDE